MNQKLVTKKNRKIRRVRELYPDVKIKIFYQRGLPQPPREIRSRGGPENVESQATPTRIPGPPQIVNLGDDESVAG